MTDKHNFQSTCELDFLLTIIALSNEMEKMKPLFLHDQKLAIASEIAIYLKCLINIFAIIINASLAL